MSGPIVDPERTRLAVELQAIAAKAFRDASALARAVAESERHCDPRSCDGISERGLRETRRLREARRSEVRRELSGADGGETVKLQRGFFLVSLLRPCAYDFDLARIWPLHRDAPS